MGDIKKSDVPVFLWGGSPKRVLHIDRTISQEIRDEILSIEKLVCSNDTDFQQILQSGEMSWVDLPSEKGETRFFVMSKLDEERSTRPEWFFMCLVLEKRHWEILEAYEDLVTIAEKWFCSAIKEPETLDSDDLSPEEQPKMGWKAQLPEKILNFSPRNRMDLFDEVKLGHNPARKVPGLNDLFLTQASVSPPQEVQEKEKTPLKGRGKIITVATVLIAIALFGLVATINRSPTSEAPPPVEIATALISDDLKSVDIPAPTEEEITKITSDDVIEEGISEDQE